jgi:outer membrane protein assembly factor BamD (BamD/ComL family)
MLRSARDHLADGDGLAALDVLDRHAREFADGELVEEREALAVKALASRGDSDAARARARRFRRQFPQSIYLPVVQRALQSIR